jgi:hypothetical protein
MASEQDNPPDIVQETITDVINEHVEVQGDVSLERNEPLETSNSTGDAEREIRTDAAEPIDFIEPNTDSKEPELETPLKIVETSKEKQETTTEKQAANNDFELPDKVLKEIQALTATKQPTARDIGPNMFKLL